MTVIIVVEGGWRWKLASDVGTGILNVKMLDMKVLRNAFRLYYCTLEVKELVEFLDGYLEKNLGKLESDLREQYSQNDKTKPL